MSRTSDLSHEPIAHILHTLMKRENYNLAHSLIADYAGDLILSDEEMLRIFEILVLGGYLADAKALL